MAVPSGPLGDELIAGPKGYMALGAFNTKERSQALDQLGFHKQLVFATFSAGTSFRSQGLEQYQTAAAHTGEVFGLDGVQPGSERRHSS